MKFNATKLLINHIIKLKVKNFKLKLVDIEKNNFNEITFDLIKRGPLLVLLIKHSIFCIIFLIELILFFLLYLIEIQLS